MIRRSWLALTFLLLVGPSVSGKAEVDCFDDPLPEGALARLGSIRFLHPGRIRHLAFLPGDRQILGVCEEAVRLWDVDSGRQAKTFPELNSILFADRNSIMCAALSPDGKTAAIAENGRRIFLLDPASGKVRNHVEGDRLGRAQSVAWSPDSRRLAAAMGPTVFIWEAASGKLLRKLQGDSKFLHAVAFTPDGNVLAFGDDRAIELWDLTTGKKLRNLKDGLDGVHATLTFAPDGKTVVGPCTVTFTNASRSSLRQWDTDGKKFRDLTLGTFNCAAFSPNGSLLAAAEGLDIHMWDPVSGKKLRKWPAHVGHIWALAFSRDGKVLASGGVDHRIRLWDAATGKEHRPTAGHLGAVNAVAFSPNGKVMASAGLDATIRFWDRFTGREIKRCDGVGVKALASHWGARNLAYSPDGKTLVSIEANDREPNLRLWTDEGKLLSRFGHYGYYDGAVAFSPDNKSVVAARGGTIAIYEARNGKVLRWFKKKDYVTALSLAPDGRMLACVGPSRPLGVLDLETGKEIFQSSKITAGGVAFSPDGSMIATTEIGGFCLRNATTGHKLSEWKERFISFAFSPDGRLIAAGTERGLALWDVLARQEARLWGSHQRSINGLAFSPDGRVLVTAHEDGTLLVWDVTGLCKAGKFPHLELGDKELEIHYADLKGDNAAHAHRAIWTLAAAEPKSLDLVAKALQPVPNDAARITRLIAELDDKSFAVRTKAMAALIELGERAEPVLRKTLLSSPPIEVQRRITTILGKLDHKSLAAKWLHTRRLLAVVEYAGTPEARRILERLAAGAPEAPMTREAAAALKRLSR